MKTTKVVSTKTTLVERELGPDGKQNPKGKIVSKVQGAAIKTNLTIDWEGCTPEDILAMAQAALIVKLQGGWRQNGTPSEIEVKAAEHKVGVRQPAAKPPTIEELAEQAKNDPEKRAYLLKLLGG